MKQKHKSKESLRVRKVVSLDGSSQQLTTVATLLFKKKALVVATMEVELNGLVTIKCLLRKEEKTK